MSQLAEDSTHPVLVALCTCGCQTDRARAPGSFRLDPGFPSEELTPPPPWSGSTPGVSTAPQAPAAEPAGTDHIPIAV